MPSAINTSPIDEIRPSIDCASRSKFDCGEMGDYTVIFCVHKGKYTKEQAVDFFIQSYGMVPDQDVSEGWARYTFEYDDYCEEIVQRYRLCDKMRGAFPVWIVEPLCPYGIRYVKISTTFCFHSKGCVYCGNPLEEFEDGSMVPPQCSYHWGFDEYGLNEIRWDAPTPFLRSTLEGGFRWDDVHFARLPKKVIV